MSLVHDVAAVLAWPSDSGVAGGFIGGAAAYVHTHVLMGRRHRARLAQAERHHAERESNAAARHNELKAHVTATLRPPVMRKERL